MSAAKRKNKTTIAEENLEPVQLQNFFSVPLDSIIADHADNGRWPEDEEDKKLAELVEMISTSGLEQPLKVCAHPDKPGMYKLVYGFRRYSALCTVRDAGLFGDGFFYPAVPDAKVELVEVGEGDEARKHAFLANIRENRGRKDPGPMGSSYICHRLVHDFGMTQTEAAKEMGKSEGWVTMALSLLTLGKELQGRIQSGEIGGGCGYELAGMDKKLRNRVVKNLDARGEKITTSAVQQEAAALLKAKAGGKDAAGDGSDVSAPDNEMEADDTGLSVDGDGEGGEEGSSSASNPEPARKKRGRKRKSQEDRVTYKSPKAILEYLDTQAAKYKEDDGPDVWNELCGYIAEWVRNSMSDATITKRGKKACGVG